MTDDSFLTAGHFKVSQREACLSVVCLYQYKGRYLQVAEEKIADLSQISC
jgi:hypothetical protein